MYARAEGAFRELLEEMGAGWRTAAERVGVQRRVVRIAGEGVAIAVAGEQLASELLPPFSHLPEAPEAAVEILAWDAERSDVPVPELPWSAPAEGEQVRFRVEQRVLAARQLDTGSATAVDPEARRGFFAVPSAERIAGLERAAPLIGLLRVLVADERRAIAHGAVLCRGDRAVIVPAMGGSGKSTLAVAAFLEGIDLVGDDIAVVELPADGGPPRAHGLYCTAKLDAAAIEALPAVRGAEIGRAERSRRGPKDVIDLARLGPGRFRQSAELTAMVVPRIDPAGPLLAPLGKSRALLALAPTSILGFGGADEAQTMGVMGELVRALPTFELRLGPEHSANVAALAALLDGEADG